MKTLLMSIALLIVFLFPAEAKAQTLEYRCYAVAGGPHIPDEAASAEDHENSIAGTTPINWLPFITTLLVTSLRN